MSSIRLTVQELNDILAGKIIDRTGGPSLKIHAHVGKERDPGVPGKISDGYHTFDELYDHRITLFIALCRHVCQYRTVWRTEYHSNGEKIDGWFLLGVNTQMGEQITYHIPMRRWDECKFASKADRAPAFDGHTSADVIDRLKKL